MGNKVERLEAILKVESRGAILIIQNAVLNGKMTGLEVEEGVEGGLFRFAGFARLGLVGGSVGIHDEVKGRADDGQVAQQDARGPQTEHADPDPQAVRLGIGRFTRGFAAVNHHATGVGFE